MEKREREPAQKTFLVFQDDFSITISHCPRRLQDVFKTCLQDVFQKLLQEVFKMSSGCLKDVSARLLPKTSQKHL